MISSWTVAIILASLDKALWILQRASSNPSAQAP
jgi:hypothetical protein